MIGPPVVGSDAVAYASCAPQLSGHHRTAVLYALRVGNVVVVYTAEQGLSLPHDTLTVDDVVSFAKKAVAKILTAPRL